jgi:Fe2+ transport system protein B
MATSLLYMLVVWGLVTVALIVVATYRSFLAKDETDRIIVSQAQSRLAMQQQQVVAKVSRLDTFVRGLAWVSGGLLVVSTVIWIWSSLSNI